MEERKTLSKEELENIAGGYGRIYPPNQEN